MVEWGKGRVKVSGDSHAATLWDSRYYLSSRNVFDLENVEYAEVGIV